jgi:malate synthase
MKVSADAYYQVANLRKAFTERRDALKQLQSPQAKDAFAAFEKKLDAIDEGTKHDPGFGPVNRDLSRLIFSVENADMRPAATLQAAAQQSCDALAKDLVSWQQLNEDDLAGFNAVLAANQQTPLSKIAGIDATACKP